MGGTRLFEGRTRLFEGRIFAFSRGGGMGGTRLFGGGMGGTRLFGSDRFGQPTTFCVPDIDDAGTGMCVFQESSLSAECRRFDHFATHVGVSRFGQSWVRRDVCLPGTDGWIGDRCLVDDDCLSGYCHELDGESAGLCTEACNRYCPDRDGGYAVTFCVDADPNAPENGGMCVNRCSSNDDCALGSTCESRARHSQARVVRDACVPY